MKTMRTKSGQPITQEMIDALAAEAVRGYDLSSLQLRRIGRPTISKKDAGLTISEVSRELLEQFASGRIRLGGERKSGRK